MNSSLPKIPFITKFEYKVYIHTIPYKVIDKETQKIYYCFIGTKWYKNKYIVINKPIFVDTSINDPYIFTVDDYKHYTIQHKIKDLTKFIKILNNLPMTENGTPLYIKYTVCPFNTFKL